LSLKLRTPKLKRFSIMLHKRTSSWRTKKKSHS
jgi:hypothetical protein